MSDLLSVAPGAEVTSTQEPDSEHPTRQFRAMGCEMAMTVATTDRSAAELVFELGRRRIEEIEACLSRFRPESELSHVNGRAGSWTAVTPLFATVLRVAIQAARRSKGLCTPTLLRPLLAAGYDRDFAQVPQLLAAASGRVAAHGTRRRRSQRGMPGHVSARQLRRPNQLGTGRLDWRAIRLLERPDGRACVWLPCGLGLDLAGVAKGWTADEVAHIVGKVGPCLIDAGGDLAAHGAPPGQRGWAVDVIDPFEPESTLELVVLRDQGIATSGTDYRRWWRDGRPQHHLIDARTGEPSRTDVLTVTVIAPTAVAADVHAKAALLLGARRGRDYLADLGLAGLIVRSDGRLLVTPRWSDYAYARQSRTS
ncbi:MAG: FAD:protein FMN transferase [Chloroflexota bacterium]